MRYNASMETDAVHKPPALTYDPAIYWLVPHVYAECSASLYVLQDSPDALRWVLDELEHTLKRGAPWAHYTTVEQPHRDDTHPDIRIFRRHAYEQPGFTYIHQMVAPLHVYQLRLAPQGGPHITLDLRLLMYRGEEVRGALHGAELYVIT